MRQAVPVLEANGYLDAETRRECGGGREIRYRRKGSLSIRLDTGEFFDHEAGVGGGVVGGRVGRAGRTGLVEHLVGVDRRGALDWLVAHRLIEPRRRPGTPLGERRSRNRATPRPQAPAPSPASSGQPSTASTTLTEEEQRRLKVARKLLAASEPLPWPKGSDHWPGRHPAFRWRDHLLASFGELPTLRWLPVHRLPRPTPDAAGALLTPRAPLADWLAGCAWTNATAVEIEYVDCDGGEAKDDKGHRKRSYGLMSGTVWATCRPVRGRLHFAEGTADALAVAPHLRSGEAAAATGGTSGLRAAAKAAAEARWPTVIHSDGDRDAAGMKAATAALRLFRRLAPGVDVQILVWTKDPDRERRDARAAARPLRLPAWLYGDPAAEVEAN